MHVCCAPDATVAMERLKSGFDVAVFFENSNIDSCDEFEKRIADLIRLAPQSGAGIIDAPYEPQCWTRCIDGLENEPEGGKRCEACFRFRLERTAAAAARNGYEVIATTLTVSPHKNAELINRIGEETAEIHDVRYLPSNFKKQDGFLKSIEISRRLGLYRQNYCGCRYSKPKTEEGGESKPFSKQKDL
ncbi:MAG: epoxyqueuosine reductase QueH [Planctomycetota bacterium]